MIKTKKIGFTLVFSLLLVIAISNFTGTSAEASSTTSPTYHFMFNTDKKQSGTEYEMKTGNLSVYVDTDEGIEVGTPVTWKSSETGVVKIETTANANEINLKRVGPGYSTITATITQGTRLITINCLVKVNLAFDYQKTGMVPAKTTNERILVLDTTVVKEKQIYLQYVDYQPDGSVVVVSGAAIDSTAAVWESDNEGVATVDPKTGFVKAVGSGTATITAISNTMSSSGKEMKISMKLIVKPEFSLTYAGTAAGSTITVNSGTDFNVPAGHTADKVPSNFTIESVASYANNLTWVVYDSSTKKNLTAGTSSKMTYEVSTMSGKVNFYNVKAGTYEIYAFANKDYNTATNAPYAYMKVIVPITVNDINIVMTVGDSYNVFDNSNIPSIGVFDYNNYKVGNQNIARVDDTTSIITAVSKGKVTLTLKYIPQNLFDSSIVVNDIDINITVIDGISLSETSAKIFTKGTLKLSAYVTDQSPVVWTSSDESIATVVDGLVTGKKSGSVTITAKQTVNGIVKKATCEIKVQQSVATIVVDPTEATISIGEGKTLLATITPTDLSGVTLKWKSSDENIVYIKYSDDLTATVVGKAGGHAVISAINQDNVVVGYSHINVLEPVDSVTLSETDIVVDLTTRRLQLRATVSPENASNKEITWSSTDITKARVDQNGLVTLLKPGTVTIIATSKDDATKTAVCNINIQIPVVSVALDESAKTMYVGESARLSYVILPSNASKNTVIWTSSNPSVVTVDNTGKVSAKGVGTSVIILKTLDGGNTVYCTITVKRVATSVKLDVSELALKSGEYYYFKTTLTPKDSTDNDLVWESSDTKVAVVDENGKVVAKDAGTAIIMVRTEAGGIAYCKITVTLPVKGLILNFSEKTVFIGDEFKLKVSVSPSAATDLGVTWKSSNPKVASVSTEGLVSGLVGGVTVITCTTIDGGYSATCVITVRESVSTIKLNHETYRLGINKTAKLTAIVSTETATNQKVLWESSNDKVATVNQKGKITGISLGRAIITATALDGSEVEATCEVRVVTPVDSVTLDKAYLSMLVGDSKELNAKIRPSNSTYRSAKWTSSDESVAIVDEDGFVTALKAGSTTITAEARDSSGKKAICYIAVRDRLPSTGITIMDKKLVMVSGEEKIVEVVLNPTASTDSYTWSTDNAAIARVDKKTGKITARSTGTANVTVMTDSGKTAIIQVTVIGLNMTELVLEQYTSYPYALQVEGATTTVSWSIDNPQIAVVTNGRVSSRSVGKATITATVNGRKLTCKLEVVKIE